MVKNEDKSVDIKHTYLSTSDIGSNNTNTPMYDTIPAVRRTMKETGRVAENMMEMTPMLTLTQRYQIRIQLISRKKTLWAVM